MTDFVWIVNLERRFRVLLALLTMQWFPTYLPNGQKSTLRSVV